MSYCSWSALSQFRTKSCGDCHKEITLGSEQNITTNNVRTVQPALLHLDPNSPEAQAFNQKGVNSNGDTDNPSPIPSGTKGSSKNGRKQGTDETVTAKNGASYEEKRLLEIFVATAVAGLVILIF
ncbi:hypothetical protein V8G54_012815 [Vigna mungo]|uniref:Uncharacterized protein n=1 Tax=Vigna mungo TaxID=3915 RepID=A0AAQ3S0Z0_VIGMU